MLNFHGIYVKFIANDVSYCDGTCFCRAALRLAGTIRIDFPGELSASVANR